jgi:4-hydroxybenzoate polyprenyltransferase
MSIRELTITCAIRNLEESPQRSRNSTADQFNVPRTTFKEHANGTRQPRRIAHQYRQRLSPEQEEFLAQWILDEEKRGYAPSHPRIREMAAHVIRMNGDIQPLGKKWTDGFLHRNPHVKSKISKKVHANRINNANPESLQEHFDRYKAIQQEHNIRPEHTWNMDEHGLAQGMCTNCRVLGSSSCNSTYVKTPEEREWVTICECCSTLGQKIRPLIVFKGKSLQTTWFKAESVPDWFYTHSQNSWTSNNIAYEWLKKIFIPDTNPGDGSHRMLIMNGHSSHITTDFMFECKINRIHCLYLPSHTSHITQPLNLALFGSVKHTYRHQISELSALDDSAPVKKHRFIAIYHAV